MADRVVVPARGQVSVSVYADQPGASGNIGPSKFTIPGLNEEKQKVIYASSSVAMDGGTKKVGILTADDLKTAESNYAEKVKQAIDNSIKPVAPFNQKVVFVPAHNVSADRKAGEEVSEFVLSGTNTVVVVYFNSDDLKSVLGKEISGIDAGTEKGIVSQQGTPGIFGKL